MHRLGHEDPEEGRNPVATIGGSQSSPGIAAEQIVAARIQKAFQAYRARKAIRRLKDAGRFNISIQGHTVTKQTTSTLSFLHSWCNVRARRICLASYGVGKENWGCSWIERWIVMTTWEVRRVRVHSRHIHPRKTHGRRASKPEKEMDIPASMKPGLSYGKVASKVTNGTPSDG
ncbi:hypothetical protein V6N12_054677 [Hibiscus sabdariffa]|uniref:Uncharacterized protein n=1 Tax=Hibiscus sabdariffa TaxID=183260 RepID=A0ABR2D154_9ROSI